jgi:lipid A 3-O-deacylase
MSRHVLCVLLLGLGLAMGQPALALDGSAIELGGGEGTAMARVNARWNWDQLWDVNRDWIATAFWESGVGYWHGGRSGGKNLWEIGLTPVFRLNSTHSNFFWEGAIGVHLLSQDRIDDHRVFGSRFSFGDMVGFGWRLGDQGRYELGYRFQHLSNADTAMPNDGMNFHQIRFGINY